MTDNDRQSGRTTRQLLGLHNNECLVVHTKKMQHYTWRLSEDMHLGITRDRICCCETAQDVWARFVGRLEIPILDHATVEWADRDYGQAVGEMQMLNRRVS
jgi:hypothetical protein